MAGEGKSRLAGLFPAGFWFAPGVTPAAGRLAPPVVEGEVHAAKAWQHANLFIEFFKVRLVGLGRAWVFAKAFNVALEVDDATRDAGADLGDVEPVGDDEFADFGVEFDVVRHGATLAGANGVDKGEDWR